VVCLDFSVGFILAYLYLCWPFLSAKSRELKFFQPIIASSYVNMRYFIFSLEIEFIREKQGGKKIKNIT